MKGKSIKEQIKEYFLKNPTAKLRVRQIERTLKVPLPSVIRYTKELTKEGVLKTSEVAGVITYTADRGSEKFMLYKKLFNLEQLYLSGLVDCLKKELSNPGIIVFGSYSKAEDTESSDIDLYIETPSKKKILLNQFEKKLERNIQIFQHSSIKEIKNKELVNNIINGVTLNGFIEVL